MNMLPDVFFVLVVVLTTSGVGFLFRAIIRPSKRMRAVPMLWRALPLAIIVVALLAGLLSRFYPRTWDVAIVGGALLLSMFATLWGRHVDQRRNGPDRTGAAITLFGEDPE